MAGRQQGRYIALVGSIGCPSCMRYTQSESFLWPPPPVHQTSGEQSEDKEGEGVAQGSGSSEPSYLHVYIIVAVLVCLFVFAVGILIINKFIRRRGPGSRTNYDRRDNTAEPLLPQRSILGAETFHVVYGASDDLRHEALRLKDSLEREGLGATLEELPEAKVTSDADVIMYVCFKKRDEVPDQFKLVAMKTVIVDVTTHLPTVSIPRNFHYSDVPNNVTFLNDFLKLLGGKVRVLMLNSGDGRLQVEVCRQLAGLLDQPPLHVVHPDPDKHQHRSQLRENPGDWVNQQIRQASFILVVASTDLVVRPNSSVLTEITNKVLDKVEHSLPDLEKVVLVSLGDYPNERTISQRPMLCSCPKIDIMDDSAQVRLLPLVKHLCRKKTDILQETCGQSDAERICSQDQENFLQAVENLHQYQVYV